jgi:hypothetical protein
MRWAFRNEDRVWRERGGRPWEETLQLFMDILVTNKGTDIYGAILRIFKESNQVGKHGFSKNHFGNDLYPGLVIFREEPPFTDSMVIPKLQQTEIIAYCIGDFIGKGEYEVITAWVDTRYRGMDIAVKARKFSIFRNENDRCI